MEQQQRLWSAEGTATHLPPPAQHDSGPWERSGQVSDRVRAPEGRRRAGREPGLLNAHHIRGEALGRGGKRRVTPQQRAAAPTPARRPCPLANCAAQRPPASVRLPLHLRRVRPADRARAVCLWATRWGQVSSTTGIHCTHHAPLARLEPHPRSGSSSLAQCLAPVLSALRPPKRQHPIITAP